MTDRHTARTDPTVLVIDNYDSFVYNLVQYVGALVPDRGELLVRRNDALSLTDVDDIDPEAVVVSPGPGTPAEAGLSLELFEHREYPTLGVCLGHQALCVADGAPIGHAPTVVHGKPSRVTHDGRGVFDGLPDPLDVGRYHSLGIDRTALPDALAETARTEDERGLVMAVRHRTRPHVGVQFHPESILTDEGVGMVANFLELYADIDACRADVEPGGSVAPGEGSE